ncbi:MAG: sigma-70 family RNA polymerase sigma factor [Deltaproteobacteria bacterium]|nr:sigma-70 family RNA polymerase sigma factor [Deltaproteobacteria bacterium]
MNEITLLYRRLGPSVYRRCLRLLSDPEEARDATQEVFVRAIRHCGKLTDEKAYLPWLCRVATNYCLNRLQHRGVVGKVVQSTERPYGNNQNDFHERVADSPDLVEARNLLSILFTKYDERARLIAVHKYIDGMTQDEIAGTMGLSRRTVGKELAEIHRVALELAGR